MNSVSFSCYSYDNYFGVQSHLKTGSNKIVWKWHRNSCHKNNNFHLQNPIIKNLSLIYFNYKKIINGVDELNTINNTMNKETLDTGNHKNLLFKFQPKNLDIYHKPLTR